MFFGGHLVLQVCRPEICDTFLKFQLQCASRCAIFVAVRRRRLNTKVHVCKHHIWFTGKFLAYKGVKDKTELNTVPSIYFQNCCNFAIDFQSYNSAMVRYKPRGEGVAAIQRDMRNKKAQQVVDWVMPLLDLDLVESSGELWPRDSLIEKKENTTNHVPLDQKDFWPMVHHENCEIGMPKAVGCAANGS